MDRIVLHGKISLEELSTVLKTAFPDRHITICNSVNEKKSKGNPSSRDLLISSFQNDDIFVSLGQKLEEKNKELKEAEESASKAVISIQTLHKQQQALFDEFALLRQRYDEQKNTMITILWNQCAKYHPDLRQIPQLEDAVTFTENEFQVGDFTVGDLLGEGQFATVRNCQRKDKQEEYALKIIKKERITSFTSLMRVSNEIDNLLMLKSQFIVCVIQVLHTQNNLYIVTEKGGRDLFEFFDEHPDGVPESWAREIISCVMKGVLYVHDQGICHRG
jgi:DNA repair ATPase RecN